MKEIDNADILLVELVNNKPNCKVHGAMNKISPVGHWRCLTQYHGSPSFHKGHEFIDRVCQAGCLY